MMRKIMIALVLSISAIGLFAQDGGLDEKWLNYMVETERRAVFNEGMILTDQNKDTFWAIYDEYEKGLDEVRKQYMNYLKRYASDYQTITDEQAADLMKMGQNAELERLMLQRKYSKKIAKEIGGKVGARFVQIDNAVYMLLSLQVMDEIPMVGDFN